MPNASKVPTRDELQSLIDTACDAQYAWGEHGGEAPDAIMAADAAIGDALDSIYAEIARLSRVTPAEA